MEALCRVGRVGSPANPNCAINFFAVASLAVFSCQSSWTDSNLICFVTVMEVCLCFLAWNRCFFRAACPWLSEFRRFFGPELLAGAFFERVLCCFVAFLWFDLFFSTRRVLRGLEISPSVSCFLEDSFVLLVVPTCYICLPAVHICDRLYRILFG